MWAAEGSGSQTSSTGNLLKMQILRSQSRAAEWDMGVWGTVICALTSPHIKGEPRAGWQGDQSYLCCKAYNRPSSSLDLSQTRWSKFSSLTLRTPVTPVTNIHGAAAACQASSGL